MHINAGNLSLLLGITFIVVAFIGLILFLFYFFSKSYDPVRSDKIVDIWKWTLGTFLVGIFASVISDGFKQREEDKNVMTAFNQYITIVVDTGTFDKKWQLCEFFVAVSPEGEMRNAWLRYEQKLKAGKDQLATLNHQEAEIVNNPNPTPTQINALTLIQNKKQDILSTFNAVETGGYLIVAGGDKNLDDAKTKLKKAKTINNNVALFKKGNMYRTVFTGLTSKVSAQNLLPQVQSGLNPGAYIVKQSNWCASYQTTPDCLICNP